MNWSTFWPTYWFLFMVVMLRANATYWVARGISIGARRWGRQRGHTGERWHRGQELVRRWGAGAVVVCFLTVGIQTAVNATAGAVKMPLRRYLPAVVLGGSLWALIYSTVGLAAIQAWLAAAVRWPGTIPITVVVVGGVVGLMIWRHRRRARARRETEATGDSPEATDPVETGPAAEIDTATDTETSPARERTSESFDDNAGVRVPGVA
ncbi:DedA family protein [Propionibacteriaceae bacterium Y2011]